MPTRNLLTINLSKTELSKIQRDINFLRCLKEFSHRNHLRLVLSGGYGLDISLGTITRPHNDVDAIVYGQLPRVKALGLITQFVQGLFPSSTVATHDNKFMVCLNINSPGFGANLYFVETANDPHKDINTIVLKNGKKHRNNRQIFLLPVMGNLLGDKFEAQNPNFHLANILFKHQSDKQAKHEQDIINLQKITNPKLVNKLFLLLSR